MKELYQKITEHIEHADAILIGASNGLSITEGLHLFADDQAFEALFGDLKRKYGLRCILQGMMARWPTEEEKWGFWSRLIHRYCGRYRPTPVMEDLRAIGLDVLAEELKNRGKPQILVGDGAVLCYTTCKELGLDVRLAPPHLRQQSAWGVARCALELARSGRLTDAASLVPEYHRLSQAERERLEKERNKGE